MAIAPVSHSRMIADSWVHVANAAYNWARKLVFPTRISESEVGVLAEIPSFPLRNTTSDFNGTIFPTGKLVNTSFRAQWNAA